MSNQKSIASSNHQKTFKFVSVAMLSAVAFVLMLLEFPLLPSNYLKMDFGDVPALIGGILFGPWWAIAIELLKNVLELIIKGVGTQMGFGNLMNFIVGCAFTVPYSIIIRKHYEKNKAVSIIAASVVSTVITVALGFVANYFITPLYFQYFVGKSLADLHMTPMGVALTATAFNPIKCAILIIISLLLVTLAIPRIRKSISKI